MVKGRYERLFLKAGIWTAVVVLSGMGLVLARATWGVYQKERAARDELNNTTTEHAKLAKEADALADQAAALDTPRGVEELLRTRYPVAKPGEEVIVLVDAPVPTTSPASEKKGIWGILTGWFGH